MSDFWHNKSVVVTGGAGMIGVHVVKLLYDAGANVLVLDNYSRGNNRIDGVEYEYCDVGLEGECRDHLKDVFAVFNLAAEVAGVDWNQSHHLEMFHRNLKVLSMPVKIASEYQVPHFLQVSSVCVYAPEHNHPCVEEYGHVGEPIAANSGYSWAKRMGERVALWSDLPHVVIVRPSNVYGPYDYFDDRAHVIPALIRKIDCDDVVHVLGSGYEEREFTHATDVARGMVLAIERGGHRRAYNLGTNGGTCIPIRTLVDILQERLDTDKGVLYQSSTVGDVKRWSDSTKAKRELGFEYRIGLEYGLYNAVRWYRNNV